MPARTPPPLSPYTIDPIRLARLDAIAGFFPDVSYTRDPFPVGERIPEMLLRTRILWQDSGGRAKQHSLTLFTLFVAMENRAHAEEKYAALSAQFMRVWKAARGRQTRMERKWTTRIKEVSTQMAVEATPIASDSGILRVRGGTQEVLLIPEAASPASWRYFALASSQHPTVPGAMQHVTNRAFTYAPSQAEALRVALDALALPVAERAVHSERVAAQEEWRQTQRARLAQMKETGDALLRR